jgi:hypothetical protein
MGKAWTNKMSMWSAPLRIDAETAKKNLGRKTHLGDAVWLLLLPPRKIGAIAVSRAVAKADAALADEVLQAVRETVGAAHEIEKVRAGSSEDYQTKGTKR